LQQPRQCLNQFLIVAFALVANGLDAREHLANGIDHREKRGGHFGIQRKFAVAELAEQVFADVRDGFEFCESEESTGALDRVNRTENAGERAAIAGIFFQVDQLAVEEVEIFAALDQELADDVIAHAESRSPKLLAHYIANESRLMRCCGRCIENQMCSSGARAMPLVPKRDRTSTPIPSAESSCSSAIARDRAASGSRMRKGPCPSLEAG
jgi:hypothetical protein